MPGRQRSAFDRRQSHAGNGCCHPSVHPLSRQSKAIHDANLLISCASRELRRLLGLLSLRPPLVQAFSDKQL
jgi:hypothetical protein